MYKTVSRITAPLWQALASIDEDAARARREHPVRPGRLWGVLALACVCLLLLHYMKYSSTLEATLVLVAEWAGVSPGGWLFALRGHDYNALLRYLWWGGWHVVCLLLLPMVLIKWVYGERLADWGWQWGEVHRHWPGYLLLLLPIMVFAVLASQRADFINHYPFYEDARRSWFDLLAWEVIYMLQFVGVEFFFRGFLVNGLRVPLGSLSVGVMCLPYLMLHFPKPWLEATGAIGFGFFLGVLALRSRSIWGGVLVHAGVALTMDIAALVRAGGLPTTVLP